MAGHFHSSGVDVAIVTANNWNGDPVTEDGVRVLTAESRITPQTQAMLDMLLPVMSGLERELHDARPDRLAAALRSWGPGTEPPSLLPPLVDGVAIADLVHGLNPVGVIGNEAFAYGVATALCRDVRRTLIAWGGDVMQFCNTSDSAERLMKMVLQRIQYVVVGSDPVRRRVIEQFGVDERRTVSLALGVDRRMFARASAGIRRAAFARYGIAHDARIVLNARRLRVYWGSEVAVEALIEVGRRHPDTYLICLGGLGTEAEAAAARRRARDAGLESRFLALDGDAPEESVAELMSIADVFLSLAKEDEPLSLSVAQGAAAGGVPVIGDQQTYRDAVTRGLNAVLVRADSPTEIAQAVSALLLDPERRSVMAAANRLYIRHEHDRDAHMTRLLRIAVGADAYAALTGRHEFETVSS